MKNKNPQENISYEIFFVQYFRFLIGLFMIHNALKIKINRNENRKTLLKKRT